MCAITLYRVIGEIRVMTAYLGVVYGSVGMVNSACDHVSGVSANVSCSDGVRGGYICGPMDIYVQFVLYDMRGCNIDVIIDPGEVD